MIDEKLVSEDNPAGRLWHVLKRLLKVSSSTSAFVAWARALAPETPDNKQALYVLGHIAALIRDAEVAVAEATRNSVLHMRPFEIIRSVAEGSFTTAIEIQARTLSRDVMTQLAMGAELVSKARPDALSDDALEQLGDEINALIERIVKGSLDEEVKTLLVKQLETIHTAVVHYRISGIEGMREALERSIGAIILEYDSYKGAEGAEEIGQFETILQKVGKIVNIGTKVKKLAGPIARWFLPEAGDGPDVPE